MGEFELIGRIARQFAGLGPADIEGIGDDCAVVPLGDGRVLALTTDLLTEGIHFLRDAPDPCTLGRKALAVNLSDVAGMGLRPIASLLSIALPEGTRGEWIERFMDGYHQISAAWNVGLIGGDTTSSQHGITINVTALGTGPLERVKRRNAARPGDTVLVSGRLGVSAAGLRDVLAGRPDTPEAALHLDPRPQVEEGAWLGARREVRAMMDISDGLASDLRHIAVRSNVAVRIETNAVPTDYSLDDALSGGEDYKLLLTADPAAAEGLCEDFFRRFGTPLYAIGRIVAGPPRIEWMRDGLPWEYVGRGYEHF